MTGYVYERTRRGQAESEGTSEGALNVVTRTSRGVELETSLT